MLLVMLALRAPRAALLDLEEGHGFGTPMMGCPSGAQHTQTNRPARRIATLRCAFERTLIAAS
jgi:hypothetical protein